ncbi:probable rhamnogalacturonate lyase B [Beta vulgaris subsp. vulgaris]|uniref:probable rhamnogalacturonate lyase B n=1 Tax=Beta vulgaris subsp. vulgaris TaxID=3555 RepID=UPI002547631D|nr:probable rhamnogalacturonate lyase B [Beta vulgaris subsp. vulgaris]
MKIDKVSKWKGLLGILFFVQLLIAGDCRRKTDAPAKGKSSNAQPTANPNGGVRVNATSNQVVLDNGIVQVTLKVPEGYVSAIRYGGIENILEVTNRVSDRGYWDIASATTGDNDGSDEIRLAGTSFKIIKQTEDQAEISFLCPKTSSLPLQIDYRYILLRGRSGFYSYAIFGRDKGMAPMDVDQIRTVYKLHTEKFRYMAVSDKLQREMPMVRDRETGQPLAYKEAVHLTNPTNPKIKGQVDDKYQYACEDKDNKLHGWVCTDPSVGIWVITPSDEFRMGGPHKQDLTSHVGPSMLSMFHSTHYTGTELVMKFANGEPWKKVFGPYLVHLNSGKGDPRALWQEAKNQLQEELKSWPYEFPVSEDFPKANQRGSVVGKLLVKDGSKPPVPANLGWVGLAQPGEAGSWQREMKGYQFWVQTDREGKFTIPNVHVGKYNLYAWAPGFIGDYKSASVIDIAPGKQINLGDQVYTPPRSGETLWEIGFPDRSAAEFFVPDPSPDLANPILNDQENKYRQYGLWDRYSEIYPKQDLTYTIGVSNHTKDWFYAQVLRRTGPEIYQATVWQVVFPLKDVVPNGNYTLQIALAAANQAELQVMVNNPDSKVLFSTLLIGKDNAIARHGIHGLYRLYSVGIPGNLLKSGQNTIFFRQSRNNEKFRGVMYDYVRLEGPASPK